MPSSIPRYAERRFGQSKVDLFVARYSVRVDWRSCSASPLMGTATSLSDIERSATSLSDTEARGNKPFSYTPFSAQKKPDLWAQKGTVKAVILFPRFDVAHIHKQCRATRSGVVLANQQYYPAVAGGGSPADTGCRSDLVWSWAAQSDRRLRDWGPC